jgi:1,4-dihydroxy-2-naphthoyl-CoA synthase
MARKKPKTTSEAESAELPPNVTVIPTVKSVAPPPPVVTYLQDLLDRARSGEVVSVMGVSLDADGVAAYFCSGIDQSDEVFAVIGCMRYAEQCLLKEFVDGD